MMKSDKLPAIQFYVGDWLKDPGVATLDHHHRGVWFHIICLMHESERRGVLLLNGEPMPDDALAIALGLPLDLLKQNLSNLSMIANQTPPAGSGKSSLPYRS